MLLTALTRLVLTSLALVPVIASGGNSFVNRCHDNSGSEEKRLKVPRISNGQPSKAGAWPMMAGFQYNLDGENYTCGATVLTTEFLLTSAHCVEDPSAIKKVFVGKVDLSKKEEGEQWLDVARVIIHPSYENVEVGPDIALLQLAKSIDFTYTVGMAQLPKHNSDIPVETDITLIGFGWTGPRMKTTKLHQVTLKVATCDFDRSRTDIFCTYDRKHPCPGDSGSPLLQHLSGDDWAVVGVHSFSYDGEERCTSGIGGHVKVSTFSKWIIDKIRQNHIH